MAEYLLENRPRFTDDPERAQVRRLNYCELSHPLRIADDWRNRDASNTRCKITISAFEGTPDEIDDINAYGNRMTQPFYGHIVEVEVDCWSRFGFYFDVYFVKDQLACEYPRHLYTQQLPGYKANGARD